MGSSHKPNSDIIDIIIGFLGAKLFLDKLLVFKIELIANVDIVNFPAPNQLQFGPGNTQILLRCHDGGDDRLVLLPDGHLVGVIVHVTGDMAGVFHDVHLLRFVLSREHDELLVVDVLVALQLQPDLIRNTFRFE